METVTLVPVVYDAVCSTSHIKSRKDSYKSKYQMR